MVVDIGCEMVELVEIVDGAAALRERCDLLRYDGVCLGDRDISRLAHLVDDAPRRAHDAFVVLEERVAAVEDGGDGLIVLAELVFILDIDDGDI